MADVLMSVLVGQSVPQTDNDAIHTIFEDLARNNPDKPVIVHGDSTLTLGQVNNKANALARRLQHLMKEYSLDELMRKDRLVCLLMSPSADRIITILALFKLGLAYLALETVIPAARIKYILRESKPLCVICTEDWFPHMNKTDITAEGIRSFVFETIAEEAAGLPCDNLKATGDQSGTNLSDRLAIVLYTSGSTGVPKGVRLTHGNILNRLRWQWREFPYEEKEFCIAKTSILFVDSVTEVWGPLLKAIPIVVVAKTVTQNPKAFIETLEKHQVTRLVLVPSLLRNMLLYLNMEKDYKKLSKLTHVVCSGETLPVELANEFFRYFNDGRHVLANYYGSTETTGDVTFEIFRNKDDVASQTFKDNLSIGKMVDNCVAYIVDEEMYPVPLGETGELVVSGLNIADGYMDESNMSNFLPNTLGKTEDRYLLKTGDYARIINGRIYYEGRKDSQIKIRGQRVDTSEIAKTLQGHQLTEQVVVLVYINKEGDATLVAYYTSKGNQELNSELETFCSESLPPYMIPRFLHLEVIPLLPATGKIDRQTLKTLYENSLRATGDITFADEVTGTVIGIVANELGIHPSHIELSQNFFQIGGNSVNAIKTLAKLSDAGVKIEIGDFLSAVSMQELLDRAKTASTLGQDRLETLEGRYDIVPIGPNFPDEKLASDLLVKTFADKEVLSVSAGLNYEEMIIPIERCFSACQKSGASFAVYSKDTPRQIVGVSLSASIQDMPDFDYMFEGERAQLVGAALQATEVFLKGVTDKGKWLTSAMMAADSDSKAELNLELMELMERKTIQLAKKAGYSGIESSNTSHVTVELAKSLGYLQLGTLKVRELLDKSGKLLLPSAPEEAAVHVFVMHL